LWCSCGLLASEGWAAAAPIVVHATPGLSGEPPALRVEPDGVHLSLADAFAIALRQNRGLTVERYTVAQAEQGILESQGVFDVFSTADLSLVDSKGATVSSLEASQFKRKQLQLGLQRLFPAGTQVGFAWDTRRDETNAPFQLSPSYTTSPGFRLSQPLMRNFGSNITRRGLTLSRNNLDISREAFVERVTNVLQAVEDTYWLVDEARAQLKVSEEGLALARELHQMNKIRVDVGTLAPLELVQSEAGIATREEDIIRAQGRVGDAQDLLRRLLNVPSGDLWTQDIITLTEADPAVPSISLESEMAAALEKRPDLQRLRLQLKNREIEAAYARNQTLPRVDIAASYGLGGAAGSGFLTNPITGQRQRVRTDLGDALNQVTGFDFPTWTLGVNFALPLQNRAAKAQNAIAELELERVRAQLHDAESLVTTEVRTAARGIDTAAKQVAAAKASRRLAEKNLDAERKRYENGMSTSFQVLQIQEALTEARSREVSAGAALRRSLVEYHRVTGRLLETNQVAIAIE
jgi:outer membrane protein TolC